MNLRGTASVLALSAAFGLVAEGLALAQAPSPNVPVTSRPRPDFDPLGVRAGSYLIFPELGTSIGYDTNVFATNDDEQSDFVASLIPVINFDSNFSRHALDFELGGDFGFYFDNGDLDYQDFYIGGDGRYDVTRDDNASVRFLFGQFHDSFEDPNIDRAAEENQPYISLGGTLDYTQTFNRFNFTPFFTGRRINYEQSFNEGRNSTFYDAGLRAGYFISPRVNVFTQGSYFMINRDTENGDGSSRDSTGYRVGVGSALDFTGLIFGEIFVGYENESFDAPGVSDEPGFAFDVGLTWNVTTLTTLGLNGRSSIETTDETDSSSELRSVLDFEVDHELLRNVLVGGLLGIQRDDYRGDRGTENTFRAGLNGTYFLNRNLRLEADYLFSTRTADESINEFDRNRVFLTLVGML